MSELETLILQAIREYNGQLDWLALAAIIGIESEALPAFRTAVMSLHRAGAFRLEFDDRMSVRFSID